MPEIYKQNNHNDKIGLINDLNGLKEIEHVPGEPSILHYENKIDYGACLSCTLPRCISYGDSELYLEGPLATLSTRGGLNVCPTNAIERTDSIPSIDEKKCFGCGLCASRCVAGAIFIKNRKAVINVSQQVVLTDNSENSWRIHENQVSELLTVKHTGEINLDSASQVDLVYGGIEQIRKKCGKDDYNFPNILSHNLLMQVGNRCIIRRPGDVYVRFDALFDSNGIPGVCEIEFDKESLEPPRALLDDIAILSCRYSVSKEEILPLIISLELPNKRSEYWNVIKDIRNVLDIKIQSITIGILLVCMWNNKNIDFSHNEFYIDSEQHNLSQPLDCILNHNNTLNNSKYAIIDIKKRLLYRLDYQF